MANEKSVRAIAKMIIECCHGDKIHGYNLCAYEFLAWYVDDESKWFDYYTRKNKHGKMLQELYFFNNMFDESWTEVTNQFIQLFTMIFPQYKDYDIMVELEIAKRKALIERRF